MARTAIVTDTNASLPGDIVNKFGIIEVPIHIQFGDESYVTGVDIDDEKLFKMIDVRNLLPTTAAPSPAAFQKAYQRAFDEGAEQIVCICCSSKVSATLQAAELAKEDFVDRQIKVVDSLSLSLGEGFQVIGAAEAAEHGASLEEILNEIERIRKHSHVYGALPTLKYLAMGGRMGKLAAGLGNTLEVKPILTTIDGKLDLLEKIRTWRRAKGRLVELAMACAEGQQIERVGLVHVNNKDGVMSLWEEIRGALNISVEPLVTEFTPGLSVHTGSGVIAFVLITA
jgi:DegV family protein with EDD domain